MHLLAMKLKMQLVMWKLAVEWMFLGAISSHCDMRKTWESEESTLLQHLYQSGREFGYGVRVWNPKYRRKSPTDKWYRPCWGRRTWRAVAARSSHCSGALECHAGVRHPQPPTPSAHLHHHHARWSTWVTTSQLQPLRRQLITLKSIEQVLSKSNPKVELVTT